MSEGNGNVMQVYTVEDVAKHNKADDIWIIVDDKVFDLTDFLGAYSV
jgi:cytochrome b involved in lipid metabolism